MTPEQFVASIRARQDESALEETQERDFAREQVAEIIAEIGRNNERLVKAIAAAKPEITIPEFPKTLDTGNKEVVKAIKGLKFPESDDSNIISSLKSLESQNVKIAELLSKLDLHVEAPQVNVDAPDLTPITKAIKAIPKPEPLDTSDLKALLEQNLKATNSVQKAIKSLVFPVANTPTDPLIYYIASDIDDSAGKTGINYFGFTDNKGAWYIKRLDNSASPKTIRLCFGQSNYGTNWTGRAGLTYTTWGS